MARVLVVNNYPRREGSEQLTKCVRENGAEVASIDWGDSSASKFGGFDGVVLSGSPEMWTNEATPGKFQAEVRALLDSAAPALGVCFGHQLIATAFGAKVVRDSREVKEMVRTSVLSGDPLFEGLSRSPVFKESREEVVDALPAGFALLARSDTSAIAAMKHEKRLLYGVQFHPEAYTADHPEGDRVVGNFVRLLGR